MYWWSVIVPDRMLNLAIISFCVITMNNLSNILANILVISHNIAKFCTFLKARKGVKWKCHLGAERAGSYCWAEHWSISLLRAGISWQCVALNLVYFRVYGNSWNKYEWSCIKIFVWSYSLFHQKFKPWKVLILCAIPCRIGEGDVKSAVCKITVQVFSIFSIVQYLIFACLFVILCSFILHHHL